MSTVFLHIGTAKTGTTALQRFLPQNSALLNQNGYDHPLMPFHFPRMGDGRNAHFLTVWNDKTEWAKRWDKGFQTVHEACDRYDHVILSDEVLWAECAKEGFLERMREGFAQIGAKLRVIVYLRRQDDMAESHWNQMVKGKLKFTKGFSEFVREGGYEESFPLAYDKGLDAIADCIGRENIIVRVYEKGQFTGGSIFADFLDTIGLTLTEEYELPEYAVNTRLPENVVEIKRLINTVESYRDEKVPNYFREVIRQAYGLEAMREIPDRRTGRFSDEERQAFMERYAAGNAYVAREYLHREDGILFYEKPASLPQWQPDEWEIQQDMVRVLAAADVYEYRKRRELESEVHKLVTQVDGLSAQLTRTQAQLDAMTEQLNTIHNSAPFRAWRRLHKGKGEGS